MLGYISLYNFNIYLYVLTWLAISATVPTESWLSSSLGTLSTSSRPSSYLNTKEHISTESCTARVCTNSIHPTLPN